MADGDVAEYSSSVIREYCVNAAVQHPVSVLVARVTSGQGAGVAGETRVSIHSIAASPRPGTGALTASMVH